jgi:fructosamine-3-kinase
MSELFGGFPREFYHGYNEAFALAPGYEQRKHLYNLYHLLNHLNIFGGGYLSQVKATLSLLAGRL